MSNNGEKMVIAVRIASDFVQARDVQERILKAVEEKGFESGNVFAIKLSLEEALINAVKHGNKLSPAKSVEVHATITPSRAIITIEDEGLGFDRSSIPDPTLEENLEKCSGRGILLMEAYMNSVRWSNHGRRVELIKDNEPEPKG